MSREQFYVATSRGRDSVQVFTSDTEALRDAVAVSGARQSATELAARAMDACLENARHQTWWVDYETGQPTVDASRAKPRDPAQDTSRPDLHDRREDREFTR